MEYKEEKMSNEDIETLIEQYQSNKQYLSKMIRFQLIFWIIVNLELFSNTKIFAELTGFQSKIMPLSIYFILVLSSIFIFSSLPYLIYTIILKIRKDLQEENKIIINPKILKFKKKYGNKYEVKLDSKINNLVTISDEEYERLRIKHNSHIHLEIAKYSKVVLKISEIEK
jgi:hypothetical protein